MREPYVLEILDQPAALQRVLDAGVDPDVRSLVGRLHEFDRIVTTGMGSSLNAMHPTFLRLAERGLPVWNLETADLLAGASGLLGPRSLLWLTSQSGESAEIVALLEQISGTKPAVLASTSDLSSTLAARADAVIDLRAGGELTVSAQSYLNTLAASTLAVDVALGMEHDAELMRAPEALAAYLADWDEHVAALDAALQQPTLFIIGRGASLAAARTGALIIKEAAKTAVEAMSAPQFRHGPLEMAGPDVGVVLLAGWGDDKRANLRTEADLRDAGAQVVVVVPGARGAGAAPALTSPPAAPLAEMVPLQGLSVALARRRGVEPGAFARIGKVTTTL